MSESTLRDIYRSVVLAKPLYDSPAWWAFTTDSDKHRISLSIEAFGCGYTALTNLLLSNSQKTQTTICLEAVFILGILRLSLIHI